MDILKVSLKILVRTEQRTIFIYFVTESLKRIDLIWSTAKDVFVLKESRPDGPMLLAIE